MVETVLLCVPLQQIMELTIYRTALFLTGLINLAMAAILFCGSKIYRSYVAYYRTRMLTTLWMATFGIGYIMHGVLLWRETWPSAASALTVSYFHLGALCFNWGYIPLMNPNYLTRRVLWRDGLFYLFGLAVYWTVALLWKQASILSHLSFLMFFSYAVWTVIKFYRTYNQVSNRILHLSFGNVIDFVRWMQVCCDLIVFFGISSVTITALFPTDFWPFTILLFAGVGMFGYMAYSLKKYGLTIEAATEATNRLYK